MSEHVDIDWALKALRELMVDSYRISKEYLDRRGWSIALAVGSLWSDDQMAKSLEYTLINLGFHSIASISTIRPIGEDGQARYDGFFDLAASTNVSTLLSEGSDRNILLTNGLLDFAVLATNDEYSIFAGPSHFVDALFPDGVDKVHADFCEFASERALVNPPDKLLLNLADYYLK